MPTIPAQVDVRTRGGKTTVRLTAAGKATIERFETLLEEIMNPYVDADLRARVRTLQNVLPELKKYTEPTALVDG